MREQAIEAGAQFLLCKPFNADQLRGNRGVGGALMPLGTPARRMPIPEDVRDFLGDLLGKPVSVTKASQIDFGEEPERFVTGLYVNDKDQELIGACISDIPLTTTAGAALAMMPAAVAKEAVEAGKLEEGSARQLLRGREHHVRAS